MKKEEAIKFIDKLETECNNRAIWCEVTKENRPDLGKIVFKLEISVKITGENNSL